MKEISPLWKKILDIEFKPQQLKSKLIVSAIIEAINNESLPLGAAIPTYRIIAKYMNIKKHILEEVWRELKDDYRLIETSGSRGTHIVSKLKKELVVSHRRQLLFDQETIMQQNEGIKGIEAPLSRSYQAFSALNAKQKQLEVIPALINHFRIIINNETASVYTEAHLDYTQDYQLLIWRICAALLPQKKVFVMFKSGSVLVKNAVSEAGNRVRNIANENGNDVIADLEALCKQQNVGIVYLRSRLPYLANGSLSVLLIKQILSLQQKYKFIIIEDDRYAGLYGQLPNLLMNNIYDINTAVIYLRPVTMIHPELNSINIMAAPAKLIRAVKRRPAFKGNLMAAMTAFGLRDLMNKGILVKYESKVFKEMMGLIEVTRQVLSRAELWKEEGIMHNEGWFFYLEPISGKLPEQVGGLLEAQHIFIIDPVDYASGPYSKKGILISIASYLHNKWLIRDLNSMNDFLRNIIN